jgi:ankyrin repeat protein
VSQQEAGLLLSASRIDDASAIQKLLDDGANVNETNEFRVTPLMRAAANGNLSVVEVLLRAGADVNAKARDGKTPLFGAIEYCRKYRKKEFPEDLHLEVVRKLIAAKADVNSREKFGLTPLMLAAGVPHPKIVQSLINAGADVNAQTYIRYDENAESFLVNPLLFAITEGGDDTDDTTQLETVRLLVESGADVSLKYASGETALSMTKKIAENEGRSWTTLRRQNWSEIIRILKDAETTRKKYAALVGCGRTYTEISKCKTSSRVPSLVYNAMAGSSSTPVFA